MGEAKFSRIFGTPVLVNFGVECKHVLLSNNEEVEHLFWHFNSSAELPVAMLLYVSMGEAKFPRIFGTPILVNFGTVIVECKNVLLSSNEEVEHV